MKKRRIITCSLVFRWRPSVVDAGAPKYRLNRETTSGALIDTGQALLRRARVLVCLMYPSQSYFEKRRYLVQGRYCYPTVLNLHHSKALPCAAESSHISQTRISPFTRPRVCLPPVQRGHLISWGHPFKPQGNQPMTSPPFFLSVVGVWVGYISYM